MCLKAWQVFMEHTPGTGEPLQLCSNILACLYYITFMRNRYFTQGVFVVWLSWIPIVIVAFYGIILKTKDRM